MNINGQSTFVHLQLADCVTLGRVRIGSSDSSYLDADYLIYSKQTLPHLYLDFIEKGPSFMLFAWHRFALPFNCDLNT